MKNAAVYSDAQSPVEVRAFAVGNARIVEVQDHGIGIDPSKFDSIFERFHQVGDDILTETNKGTGLGLAIAKDVVELHGGSIHVESELNKGTRLRVVLPAHPRVSRPRAAAEPSIA
jgi:signal transduction histidine kinase